MTFHARQLAQRGIVFMEDIKGYLPPDVAFDYALAMDAQPALVTTSNAGIPAYMTNWVDPNLIEVLLTPNQAAEIAGEAKKGDWTTLTSTFPVIESTGQVSSYDDFGNNGMSGVNANFPQRQSYHFQTNTVWGERELAIAGEARIDWASRLNIASAITIDKARNKIYFFGVAGLQNYGLLNDPNLFAAIAPAGGTAWSTKDASGVYEDIRLTFVQLQTQARGLVTNKSKMTLAMSPEIATNLLKTNQYNVNVEDTLKKNFPNLEVKTAVEYNTGSGQLVQLIVDNVEGQQVCTTAFTEKMRAHSIERKTSSFLQKKSAGAWGTIIFQPFAIAQMLGV